jgi:hypothetical protein
MNRLLALALLASLASCGPATMEVADVKDPGRKEIAIPAGASVAEAKRIRAANERVDSLPIISPVGEMSGISRIVLLDVGTGCQYVVRAMYQDAVDLSARMERDPRPGNPIGSRQRCGASVPGSKDVKSLTSGVPMGFHAGIETDRETGCQYMVVSYWQDDVRSLPRTMAAGDERRHMCSEGAAR